MIATSGEASGGSAAWAEAVNKIALAIPRSRAGRCFAFIGYLAGWENGLIGLVKVLLFIFGIPAHSTEGRRRRKFIPG